MSLILSLLLSENLVRFSGVSLENEAYYVISSPGFASKDYSELMKTYDSKTSFQDFFEHKVKSWLMGGKFIRIQDQYGTYLIDKRIKEVRRTVGNRMLVNELSVAGPNKAISISALSEESRIAFYSMEPGLEPKEENAAKSPVIFLSVGADLYLKPVRNNGVVLLPIPVTSAEKQALEQAKENPFKFNQMTNRIDDSHNSIHVMKLQLNLPPLTAAESVAATTKYQSFMSDEEAKLIKSFDDLYARVKTQLPEEIRTSIDNKSFSLAKLKGKYFPKIDDDRYWSQQAPAVGLKDAKSLVEALSDPSRNEIEFNVYINFAVKNGDMLQSYSNLYSPFRATTKAPLPG